MQVLGAGFGLALLRLLLRVEGARVWALLGFRLTGSGSEGFQGLVAVLPLLVLCCSVERV